MNRILIVDDDPEQQKDIQRAARLAGFAGRQLVTVGTVQEALEALDESFSLALVDIMLTPSEAEEGVDLIREIKKRQPDCVVLAITTKAPMQSGSRALPAGASDFVPSNRSPSNEWVAFLSSRIELWADVISHPV